MSQASLLFMPYLSASFLSLLVLTVCLLLISCIQSIHKQFGCLDNCIQVLCERVVSSLWPACLFKIRGCFFRQFFWVHVWHLNINTPVDGKLSYLPLLSGEKSRGIPFFPWPAVFLLSIHCHCLLIGSLFGQPGVTGPKCDSTFLPLEPM